MNATRLVQPLLIAALLGSMTAQAAESTIAIALEDGRQVATSKVGDSRCILKDDQIRCTATR